MYPLRADHVTKSPFKTMEKVREAIRKYHQGKSIGFSRIASLRSMGLIPRADGTYRLGDKYRHEH